VYAPARAPQQDHADDLEALSVTRYTFHRPLHQSARHQPGPQTAAPVEPAEPACASTGAWRPSLPLAIAVVIAFLAADLVLTVLIATGLH
jgi:hypothetical protein